MYFFFTGSLQEFTIYVIELLADNKALYKPCKTFKVKYKIFQLFCILLPNFQGKVQTFSTFLHFITQLSRKSTNFFNFFAYYYTTFKEKCKVFFLHFITITCKTFKAKFQLVNFFAFYYHII